MPRVGVIVVQASLPDSMRLACLASIRAITALLYRRPQQSHCPSGDLFSGGVGAIHHDARLFAGLTRLDGQSSRNGARIDTSSNISCSIGDRTPPLNITLHKSARLAVGGLGGRSADLRYGPIFARPAA